MKVKLQDIARHLNISVSTVSRVLNNKDRVDEKTRERVLKALEELNYQPNEIARSLRNKSSRTVGIIVPDISNEFFTMLIKGAEAVAKRNGYLLILCNSDNEEALEENYFNLLVQKQVDGLIIATVCKEKSYFERILNYGIPLVFTDNLPHIGQNYNYVAIDNEKAAYDLTRYLIGRGYKDIAAITGRLHETTAVERLNGWKRAMAESGLKIDKNFIGIGEFKKESGYSIMAKMLEGDKKPRAVLAANNYIAYGAIKAIQDRGLRIPEDICVACFDANDSTGLIKVDLPSMVQPAEKIGELAFDIIINRIGSKEYKIFNNIKLEAEFIEKR